MAQLALEIANVITGSGVKAAYGEPQEVGGATILPVAAVWYGFGAGADATEGTDGPSGGGGGGYSVPLGAYVRQGDELRFEPNIVVLAAVAIPLLWVTGRALSRIVRALKR